MVTEIKPTFATFAKWRISPIYMVFLVKIMDKIMLMKMRITCQSFCSLSTMVVLRWASLIWKTKNSAQTLTSTSRRSSPRRSSPWDIFNRNCHNLCRILPAQVIKLLHVPILWMRPDFQWCHKKKSMKFAKEVQAKTPHAQTKYVEDFTISCQADGSKVVEFKENPTKTRHGGLRNPTRYSPQQMWSTDEGERDPVRLFKEWLSHRLEALKNSGLPYLRIIYHVQ